MLGADVGATLVKLALRTGDGPIDFHLLPVEEIERVAREVESRRPVRVGLTGGAAPQLAERLRASAATIPEFEAWASGMTEILERARRDVPDRYLAVSLGTGTSALLVTGEAFRRVGGTALGGGTVLGLGAALLGSTRFDEITELARAGDRRNVDLLVSDIYAGGGLPLPGDMNASSFAKLARDAPPAGRADLAHAIMGLVGENVALVCGGLAALHEVRVLAFGGSTLRKNDALVAILRGVTAMLGREAIFPADAEFAGALGALRRVS